MRRGKPVKITEVPRPKYFAYIFVFLTNIITYLLWKLTPSDQAKVTRQLRISLSDLVEGFLAGLPCCKARQTFFTGTGNPLSAALILAITNFSGKPIS